jgi:hypothetical protein
MANEFLEYFEPLVLNWLTVISHGTNKKAVKQLLSPKGVSFTFGLSNKLSTKLFNKWQKEQSPKQAKMLMQVSKQRK